MQSEKSKKAGNAPPTTLFIDFLKSSHRECPELVLLEEDMNFNQRAASLMVSTDLSLQSDVFRSCSEIIVQISFSAN